MSGKSLYAATFAQNLTQELNLCLSAVAKIAASNHAETVAKTDSVILLSLVGLRQLTLDFFDPGFVQFVSGIKPRSKHRPSAEDKSQHTHPRQ